MIALSSRLLVSLQIQNTIFIKYSRASSIAFELEAQTDLMATVTLVMDSLSIFRY